MMNKAPLLAIRCLTYNQEHYIRQCLEGFIIQKTTFPFIAIVHDDASTDKTAEIIEEYALKYPDIIKPILEKENQYSKHDGSLGRILNNAIPESVKYIAMCEGDDYWTDPLKLQIQVDFLENNPEHTLCFHNAKVIYESEELEQQQRLRFNNTFSNIENRDYSGIEIYENWIIPTASVVFKKEILNSDIYKTATKRGRFRYGDIILFLSCCHYGKIRGFKEIMSVYRRLESGMVFQDKVNDHTTALLQHHSEIPIIFGEKFKSPSRRQKTYVYLSAWINHKRFLYVIKAFFNYPSFFIKLLLKIIKRNIATNKK